MQRICTPLVQHSRTLAFHGLAQRHDRFCIGLVAEHPGNLQFIVNICLTAYVAINTLSLAIQLADLWFIYSTVKSRS